MNLDFLNIQPPKQPTSIDLPKKTETTKDTFKVKDREEFQTRKTKTETSQEKPQTSDFANFLSQAEKPVAESSFFVEVNDLGQTQIAAPAATEKLLTQPAQTTPVLITQTPVVKQDDAVQFIKYSMAQILPTKETVNISAQAPVQSPDVKHDQSLLVQVPNIMPEQDMSDFYAPISFDPAADVDPVLTEEMLSKIVSLNADIGSLLKTIKDAAPKVDKPETLTVSNTAEAAPSEDLSILDLLALVMNTIEPQDGHLKPATEDTGVILDKISALLKDDSKAALLGNFTPEELTKLQASLEDVLKGQPIDEEDHVMLDALVAQVVTLKPVQEKVADPQVQAKIVDIGVNDTKSTLQPDVTKSALPTVSLPEKHFTQSRYDARYDIGNNLSESGTEFSDADFKAALKDAQAGTAALKAGNDNVASKANPQSLMANSGLSSLESSLTQNASLTTTSSTAGQASAQTLFQSTLTNVVTQSSGAAYPHPATQAVVATIHKAVKAGEDTNIKLQLDPPELGRVEVKMSISKDAKTKIVLTAEKAETLLLLQKDSQILDRALQNAGLDTNQSSLSFELARDNQNFGSNNHGGHNNGGKGSSVSGDDDLIETVMNWHIDPNTGSMRYNALV